jgi:hypothetical protein
MSFINLRVRNSGFDDLLPGANPTIMSYNTSVVFFYNATGSQGHFENKHIFFPFQKRSSLLQRWRCSFKLKNRRIGSWYAGELQLRIV